MKKIVFIVVYIMLHAATLLGQVPNSFNYQAVIRNAAGELVVNQEISIQLSILEGTETSTPIYTETHSVESNAYGMISLKVGEGTTTDLFSGIDWTSATKYIKVDVDVLGGTDFVHVGTSELVAVPYALFADNVVNKDDADADSLNEIQDLNITSNILTITNNPNATPVDLAPFLGTNTDNQFLDLKGTELSISGGNMVDLITLKDGVDYADSSRASNISKYSSISDYSDSTRVAKSSVYADTAFVAMTLGSSKVYTTNNDTLFVVKDNLGRPVFAVFPDGVKVIVDQSAKGNIGGFAVSGRTGGKAEDVSIFSVTPDSTRIYVNDGGVKGSIGGFAVSGRTGGKAGVTDIFTVNTDSTRIYIDESAKGNIGGFAVSGRTGGKAGVINDYFNVSGVGSAGLDTINPSEPRMLWYPKSEAFLVGRVLIEDADSVGLNSISTGYKSKAIGDYSQALGYQSIARNNYSTAIGKNAVADGESSYAFGDNALTKNSADNSYAIGTNATAQGSNSYAFGNGTIADGAGSFAFGAGGRDSAGVALSSTTIAGGDNSFAMGLGAGAYGVNSFSIGTGTYVASTGENAVAIGFETVAAGRYSMALGYKNQSTGISSMTWGGVRSGTTDYTNVASGRASTAWGFETLASGSQSTAWGQNTEATGTNSTAFGLHSDAIGYVSTAWGRSSKAYEYQSTAWAGGTAWGSMSTAVGGSSVATAHQSFVIGYNNDTIYTNSDPYYTSGRTKSNMEWFSADPLFVIGNGNPSYIVGKRNAFTVLKDGTTIVGWDASIDNTVSEPDLRFNASVVTPRADGFLFYVHGEAGGTGAWVNDSDKRLKKNIQTIDSALDKVLKLRGVTFEWKDANREGLNIGFIAQEAKEVIPEVVTGSEETKYSMQYAPITAVLVEAVKEQQTKIDSLEQQNKELLERLKKLEEIILNE